MLLAGVTAYLILACSRHEPLRWRKIVIPVPSPRIAFAQIARGVSGDLLCAAGVLYALLPAAGAHRLRRVRRDVHHRHRRRHHQQRAGRRRRVRSRCCCCCSARCRPISCSARCSPIASSIISCRSPWRCALLGAHELWAHRGPMVRIAQARAAPGSAPSRRRRARMAVFGAGAVLLLSGSTPGHRPSPGSAAPIRAAADPRAVPSARQRGRRRTAGARARPVPPPRRRLVSDHVAAVRRRASVALQGIRLRGGDRARARSRLLLVSARARFRRRASIIEQRFSLSWVVAMLLVLGAAVWLVLFAYRHVPYSKELWWEFAFRVARAAQLARVAHGGNDGRSLRALPAAAPLQARDAPPSADRPRARGACSSRTPTMPRRILRCSGTRICCSTRIARPSSCIRPRGAAGCPWAIRWGRLRSSSRWCGTSSRTATTWRSSRCSIRSPPTTCRCTSISGSRSASSARRRACRSTPSRWRARRARTCAIPIGARKRTAPSSRSCRAGKRRRSCPSCARCPRHGSRRSKPRRSAFRSAISTSSIWRISTSPWCAAPARSSRSPTSGAQAPTPSCPPI